MWRRLLLWLLLLGERLLQPGAFPGVVLPVQQLLLIDELGTLSVDQLLPEVFVLQQLQHVQTVRILEELGVLRLLPVQQVLQVVDEWSLSQDTSLSKKVQVVWVGQTLDKLQLGLETIPGLLLCFHGDDLTVFRSQQQKIVFIKKV